MSPPETLATIAGRILADVVTGQPVQDPREGAHMPNLNAALTEARRHHAAVCRDHNPTVTDDQIDGYWHNLGPVGREGYLRTAEQHLAREATR